MKLRIVILSLVMVCLTFQGIVQPLALALQPLHAAAPSQPTLVSAVVCESVKDLSPQNPAIVFSVAIGKVFCFCAFDPVLQKTSIYHNWYYRDKLTNKIKLNLKTPRWSTYSTIQLRESDTGPWRVDITDQKGRVINTLRFSVSE